MFNEDQFDEEPQFRLSDVFRTMREGILILSQDKLVTAANEAALTLFVQKAGTVKGKRLSEVIRDFELHEAFDKAIKQKLSTEVRFELVSKDTRIFDVLVSPLDLSKKYAAIGIFYEQTKIERLERVRQEFLSNISHELRTPLTSILAFVETLSEGAIDDEDNNRRFLEVIRKNAERMSLLIDDISELSSIEAGSVSVSPVKLDAAKMVDEIISSLSALAVERNVSLKNELQGGTWIVADVVRLQQMLTNLIENAIKFNRDAGKVRITHESEPAREVIHVSDTGEGIPRAHLHRVFERFYRIDKARSREVGGTGLGLSIVKHLARLHGGEVSVSSTPGKGTTFSLFFPKR